MGKRKKAKKRKARTAPVAAAPPREERAVAASMVPRYRLSGWPIPYLVAVGAVLLMVGHLFLTDEYFAGSGTDSVSEEHPTHFFATYWLSRGILPLWNPYIFGGVPFQTGIYDYLYPGYWTGLLFRADLDIKVVILLHLLLGATGGVWLARGRVNSGLAAATCGVVYALSAFNVMHLFAGHRQMIATAAYLPWVAGCLDRALGGDRRALFAGVGFTGMMMLAGHLHIVYVGMGGLLLFALFQATAERHAATDAQSPLPGSLCRRMRSLMRPLYCWLALFTGGALIAALQIFPIVSTVAQSQRTEGDVAFASSWSSAPANLLTFLLPNLFGNRVDARFVGDWGYWESLGYLGLVPLSLIALGVATLCWRRTLPLLLVMCGALAVGLGSHTPLFDLYLKVIPGAELLRSPGRYTILVTLLGGFLCAQALDAWLAGTANGKKRSLIYLSLLIPPALAILALSVLGSTDLEGFRGWLTSVGSQRRLNALDSEGVSRILSLARADAVKATIVLSATSGVLWTGIRRPDRTRLLAIVLLVLCTADLLHWGHRFLTTRNRERFHLPAATADFLKRQPDPTLRVIPPAEVNWYNFPAMVAIGNPAGYANFMTGRWARYLNRSQGRELDHFFALDRLRRFSRLVYHLGPRYLLTFRPLQGGRNRSIMGYGRFAFEGRIGGIFVYRDDHPAPRAVLVHRTETVANEEAVYRRMQSPSFDIREVALLNEALPLDFPEPEPARATGGEEVGVELYEPNRVRMRVVARSRAILVLSDVLHPGWRARVDDQPVPMVAANLVMRAVPVPAGRHVVEMTYLPKPFVAGVAVSALSLLLFLGAFVALRGKLAAGNPSQK